MKAGTWVSPRDGKVLTHADVIDRAGRSQVVLLGEQHDRADNHRWQMHVTAGLLAHRPDIVMGFEMFPARLTPVLMQWSDGQLTEAEFIRQSEWNEVWRFDPELYMPIFRFCRDHAIPMVGLNCRRGLVSEVGKDGWDAIAETQREGITPARPATPEYRQYLFDITGGQRADRAAQSPDDSAFDRFVRAQQTWDRAFACRIAQVVRQPGEPLVVGIIGRGHLEFGHGTPFQLTDLGITASTVLLPHDSGVPIVPDVAEAVCFMAPSPNLGTD
ncbi:ChaN family lipoprotein [Pukyongiella litopenaei]|uniref:ChaN family lipoprotein n=1 Tax=Pukyongiella litopenaei TaxID=2605946 RepID=A0A2S0MQ26_9RHOB|nr:ChaN family lipoprotein [Pukyongiella litopenaei]AVO37946.1 ChaN family lipoprotein [Pukyongiella litopenaei]